jgi:nucleoid-associated protein YgaU
MANRYRDIQTAQSENRGKYKVNAVYPELPPSQDDLYVITTTGDRYDLLAKQFYNDHTLWWIIAAANNSQKASLIPTPGVQIRIPADKDLAIQLYNTVNSTR